MTMMLSISLRYIPGSPTGEEIMGALLSQSIHGTALGEGGHWEKGKQVTTNMTGHL